MQDGQESKWNREQEQVGMGLFCFLEPREEPEALEPYYRN